MKDRLVALIRLISPYRRLFAVQWPRIVGGVLLLLLGLVWLFPPSLPLYDPSQPEIELLGVRHRFFQRNRLVWSAAMHRLVCQSDESVSFVGLSDGVFNGPDGHTRLMGLRAAKGRWVVSTQALELSGNVKATIVTTSPSEGLQAAPQIPPASAAQWVTIESDRMTHTQHMTQLEGNVLIMRGRDRIRPTGPVVLNNQTNEAYINGFVATVNGLVLSGHRMVVNIDTGHVRCEGGIKGIRLPSPTQQTDRRLAHLAQIAAAFEADQLISLSHAQQEQVTLSGRVVLSQPNQSIRADIVKWTPDGASFSGHVVFHSTSWKWAVSPRSPSTTSPNTMLNAPITIRSDQCQMNTATRVTQWLGQVSLTQPQFSATCQDMTWQDDSNQLTLIGSVSIRRPRTSFSASQVVLQLESDTMVARGAVSTRLRLPR